MLGCKKLTLVEKKKKKQLVAQIELFKFLPVFELPDRNIVVASP